MKYEVKFQGVRRQSHYYSATVEVEADSEEQAKEKAEETFLEDDSAWAEDPSDYSYGCIEVTDVEVEEIQEEEFED